MNPTRSRSAEPSEPSEQPTPARIGTAVLSSSRALALAVSAVILEMLLILPAVDKIADRNPTAHFTQHGGIFLGGVLMGIALRDMYLASRR